MKTLIRILERIKKTDPKKFEGTIAIVNKTNGESGFSLIEVICAQVILLIALLGVFVTFTYSISYNAGNSSRSQALAFLQQEVEKMRSKKFTHDFTDTDLYGGVKADKYITATNGNKFKVSVTIDNNPLTPDVVDTDESVKPTLKQIIITVTLDRPTPGWQTSVPATVMLQRVRGN